MAWFNSKFSVIALLIGTTVIVSGCITVEFETASKLNSSRPSRVATPRPESIPIGVKKIAAPAKSRAKIVDNGVTQTPQPSSSDTRKADSTTKQDADANPTRLVEFTELPIKVDDTPSARNPTVEDVVAKVEFVPVELDEGLPEAPAVDADGDDDYLDTHDIDLTTALQLVSGQNPQVAFAQERIHEAFAEFEAAKVLWLPSIRAGVSFNRHEGTLQNSNGAILDVNRSSLQTGFGVQAVGAGTPVVPGLAAQFHITDAIFGPRIAERTAAARQYASTATLNDQMLAAALAYLELLRANQELAIANDTLLNATELARLTDAFSRTGQGAQADADRAQTELAVRKNDVSRAEEAVQVASARLAEVLHLGFPVRVQTAEQTVVPIDLVTLDDSVQQMVTSALTNRPELSESRWLVAEACERMNRERYAPLLPSVLLGVSYGGFGGGVGDRISDFQDRVDFDAVAFWEVRNLGRGDQSIQAAARSRYDQARYREIQTMDRVAREVIEARAQVKARQNRISTAESAITAATASYKRNQQRINDGLGLPIEVLQSIQALDQVRREYLRAVVEYNEAQFRLHRALGWPSAQELVHEPARIAD